MNQLQVDIVTPERSIFSGQVREVLLPAWEGQLGVLPDHDALLSLLRCGVCEVREGDRVHRWVIGRGFADLGGDHVTVLTERALPIDALDKDVAKRDLDEAYHALEQDGLTSEAIEQIQVRIEWDQAVLDA